MGFLRSTRTPDERAFARVDHALFTIGGGVRQLAGVLGVDLYQHTDDRRLLEDTILPYFAARDEYSRILFVGCTWFTQRYQQLFAGKEYWTLEPNPDRQRFGAERHIVGFLRDIGRHFVPDSLDAIFCNGLLGWGLDRQWQIERAFNACVDCLRPGGVFVLGWNDMAQRRPCRPEDCQSLRRLQAFEFPPLHAARHRCRGASRHTYDFYVKESGQPDSR